MKWIECTIETLSSADGLASEIVTGMLLELGITGIETVDDYQTRLFLENNRDHWDYADDGILSAEPDKAYIRFYVDGSDWPETNGVHAHNEIAILTRVQANLDDFRAGEFGCLLGSLTLATRLVDDADWVDNWKKYYKPFRVGKRLVVRPVWETYEAGPEDVIVTLDPGQAFGTGLHQSTRLCMEAMEPLITPETAGILDIGCGSGILAIAALLLAGGARAVAVDTDRAAVKAATENIKLNGLKDRVAVYEGNLLMDRGLFEEVLAQGPYDFVFVNIVADVVIAMAPLVSDMLRPGGVFIASGIIKDRLDGVAEAIGQNGFHITDTRRDGEWVAVISRL